MRNLKGQLYDIYVQDRWRQTVNGVSGVAGASAASPVELVESGEGM